MSKPKGNGPQFTGVYSELVNHNAIGTEAKNRVALLEIFYRNRIIEMAMHRFKWEGLPDNISERFLEKTLFFNGLAVFFKGDITIDGGEVIKGEYQAMRAASYGRVNQYDDPTHYVVTGNTMVQNKMVKASECVPIWSNYSRTTEWDLTLLYASKLAEIERTFETNIVQLRTPYLVATSEEKKASTIAALKEIRDGEIAVGTFDPMLQEAITAFTTGLDSNQPLNVQLAKQKVWNECMTFLGINNANQEKRERLVASEVGANDSQIGAFRRASLDSREYACEEINKMFGLNISVRWNEDESLMDNTQEGSSNESDNASGGRTQP